jgi:hypothetical protein
MNKISLKKIYLYFFSALGLILVIIAGTRMISLTLKTFVLTEADVYYEYPVKPAVAPGMEAEQPSQEEIEKYQAKQQTSQRQRELAESLAMILVGFPLYLYHWRQVKKLMDEEA